MEQLLLLCGGLSPPALCRLIPALSLRPLDPSLYRGTHLLTSFLVGTNRMDCMPNHQECLEGHHYLIVFHVIADEHQDFFCTHMCPPIFYRSFFYRPPDVENNSSRFTSFPDNFFEHQEISSNTG